MKRHGSIISYLLVMKRFAAAFLTTSAILIVLLNLVLILIYGRQFQACSGWSGLLQCNPTATESLRFELTLVNLIVLVTLALLWWAIRVYIRLARRGE